MESCEGFQFTQITNRIAALTFDTNVSDGVYKARMKEISDGLKRNFQDQYKIFNVSQKRSDLGRANSGAVVELGWPDQLAPPLDRLCSICKQIENWLGAGQQNIAIIHCKGGCSRAAIVVAAYMNYTNICCVGGDTVADRFSMQLFSEKYLGIDYGQPSHKRYLKYFANLLLGTVKVNPAPIFLTQITISRLFVGRNIVLKIYERMKPVHTTLAISLSALSKIELRNDNGSALSLRGDVLLKCFQTFQSEDEETGQKENASNWDLLFQCQFNTCALDFGAAGKLEKLIFFRNELDLVLSDGANADSQAGIELSFLLEPPRDFATHNGKARNGTPSRRGKSTSPVHSTASNGLNSSRHTQPDFTRADSYENFERPEGWLMFF